MRARRSEEAEGQPGRNTRELRMHDYEFERLIADAIHEQSRLPSSPERLPSRVPEVRFRLPHNLCPSTARRESNDTIQASSPRT